MNCPACVSESLVMSERQGIEIDYCSKCRGVWLDRGELDKIIERSVGGEPARDTERDQRGRGRCVFQPAAPAPHQLPAGVRAEGLDRV